MSTESGELAPTLDAALALTILEKLPTPLCLRDHQRRYVWANSALAAAFGRAPSELVGKTDFDLLLHDQALLEQSRDERVFREGRALFFEDRSSGPATQNGMSGWHIPLLGSDQSVEYVLRQWGTGSPAAAHAPPALPAEESVPSTPNAEESVRMLKEQQNELLKKERLIVVGQLTGSLAHSIGNQLAAISNAVAFLRRELSGRATAAIAQALDIAHEEVWNANRIIRDMLAYSRIRPPAQRAISVQELVDAALAEETVPQGVSVDRRLGTERVYVDPGQVQVAMTNLVRNACEAMNDQGTLTIASRRDEDAVELVISDTGVGISREEIALLFEPLVTSKALGIGLGLTTARALVANQGGTLECEGERGKGARFKLRLPAEGSSEGPESRPPPSSPSGAAAHERA